MSILVAGLLLLVSLGACSPASNTQTLPSAAPASITTGDAMKEEVDAMKGGAMKDDSKKN